MKTTIVKDFLKQTYDNIDTEIKKTDNDILNLITKFDRKFDKLVYGLVSKYPTYFIEFEQQTQQKPNVRMNTIKNTHKNKKQEL